MLRNAIVVALAMLFLGMYAVTVSSYQSSYIIMQSALSSDTATGMRWFLIVVPFLALAGTGLAWIIPDRVGDKRHRKALWMSYCLLWGAGVLGCMLYVNCKMAAVARKWVLVVQAADAAMPRASEVLRRNSIACASASPSIQGTEELLIMPDVDERVGRARRLLQSKGFQCLD